MKLDDLVILQYAPNRGYVRVVAPTEVEGLRIDLRKKTFSHGEDFNIAFGQIAYWKRKVIGVYVKKDIGQLNSMVYTATEQTRDYRGD